MKKISFFLLQHLVTLFIGDFLSQGSVVVTDRIFYYTPDVFFKKWANPGLFLFILVIFSIQFEKSVDGVLGI